MKVSIVRIFSTLLLVAGVAAVVATPASAAATGARIALLQGQGERSSGPSRDAWIAAAQGDIIEGGFWVRTLANSQIGLIVPARNQIRLNQNSEMQLKTADESKQFTEAKVTLAKGRAWSQARPRPARGGAVTQPQTLAMETPSATLSIRGTDWEVEVDENGRTQVVVLSGVVDMGNAFGDVQVAKGEAAVAEVGKAPVKLVLINPETRVQWVSSWQPQPSRWLGADSGRYAAPVEMITGGNYSGALAQLEPQASSDVGAAILAADLLIQQGEIERAATLLAPHARDGQGDPRAAALLARAEARRDHLPQAEQVLESALTAHPENIELLLARGELAILSGDAPRATRAFKDAVARDPNSAEGWYGLGLIASEREYVREARKQLRTALEHDPALGKAEAELAAVDSFAGNLKKAEQRLTALLEKEPANYLALTTRGINRLKQGDPEAGLQDFMQAGLIEPRYARAWLYSGVAFYQQGEQMRAMQAFQKAEELDARDPIPHMMVSQAKANELDYGAAIVSARKAQELMPYLRSLNQLANDQRGSANVGSPLADFGLDEWATNYAYEAYSPYWGGSHLFLADRYTGFFNKNSELMKGFITDPLAFGASNRDATLVQKPGHYGRLDADAKRDGFEEGAVIGTANGLFTSPIPIAYFVRGEESTSDSRRTETSSDGEFLTAGIGVRLRHDLGIFAFGADNSIDSHIQDETLPDDERDQQETRGDIGINFKLTPENQFWLKTGNGSQRNIVFGEVYSEGLAGALNDFVGNIYGPLASLDRNHVRVDGDDVQFRHVFSALGATWSWGVETSDQTQTMEFITTHVPIVSRFSIFTINQPILESFAVKDEQAYVSGRMQIGESLDVEGGVFYQDSRSERDDLRSWDFVLINRPINIAPFCVFSPNGYMTCILRDQSDAADSAGFNPRLGLKWRIADDQNLRMAWQKWRKPAAFGTLSPIDTLGIALNDRLVSPGGEYERARLQYDAEFADRWFVQTFVDYEQVDNGLAGKRSPLFSFQVEQLTELRSRAEFFASQSEIEGTPVFGEGSVASAGVAVNMLATERFSLAARYLWRDSEQDNVSGDLRIPYIPTNYLKLGGEWSLPHRILLGAHMIYRDSRYEDQANQEQVEGGWSLGLRAYWESPKKHHTVQAILDNLSANDAAMVEKYKDTYFKLQYSLRF